MLVLWLIWSSYNTQKTGFCLSGVLWNFSGNWHNLSAALLPFNLVFTHKHTTCEDKWDNFVILLNIVNLFKNTTTFSLSQKNIPCFVKQWLLSLKCRNCHAIRLARATVGEEWCRKLIKGKERKKRRKKEKGKGEFEGKERNKKGKEKGKEINGWKRKRKEIK